MEIYNNEDESLNPNGAEENSSVDLNIDNLMNLNPKFDELDVVNQACRNVFMNIIKHQESVFETFFSNVKMEYCDNEIDPDWFDFDEFSVLFVCQAIANIKDPYGIYEMLDTQLIEERLLEMYMSPNWKKIGFCLYTMLFADLVKDRNSGITFRQYMDSDRRYWADKIYEKIREPSWIENNLLQCTDNCMSNRDINTIFVKLHLLDPTTVFPAYTHMKKNIPDLNLELVTTNYLGEPFDWKIIKNEIEIAVGKQTLPSNMPKITIDDYEYYCGVKVAEFIMQVPKDMGIWSGIFPDNKRLSTFKDRCFIM